MSIEIVTNDVWLYLPPPHSREGSSHFITNAVFSPIYICEKPASLAYQEKENIGMLYTQELFFWGWVDYLKHCK